MDAKCFLLDRRKLLDGSVNLTHYGFAANYEHGHYIAESHVVCRVLKSFEELWEQSTDVSTEMVIWSGGAARRKGGESET